MEVLLFYGKKKERNSSLGEKHTHPKPEPKFWWDSNVSLKKIIHWLEHTLPGATPTHF